MSAQVNRVLSEKAQNGELKVTGVEFSYNGESYLVNANKEVVLSAGWVAHALYISSRRCSDHAWNTIVP